MSVDAPNPDPATPAPTPSPGATERRQVGGRNLPIAIAAGLVLAVLFLGGNFLGPAPFAAVVGLLATIGLVETSRTLAGAGYALPVPVLLAALYTTLGGVYLVGVEGQPLGMAVLFIGSFGWALADRDRRDVLRNAGGTMFLGLWVALFASYAVLLRLADDGAVLVLAVIGAAVMGDIGGFAVGVRFGRTKIAPSVSPAKSYEGLAGGLGLAAGMGALVLPNVGDTFAGRPLFAAGFALSCALAAFFGDLFESMVKRDVGIKDLGAIIPGHGGVLDRLDGVLIALPVGYYVLRLVVG